MKVKFFLLTVALTIVGVSGFAQGFHLGVKGGVNLYKIDSKSFKEEFKTGYNAGVFAEIDFSDVVGIQPEILWNQSQTRTTKEFDDIYNGGVSNLKNVKLDYLSIPLLLNLRPSKLLSFQLGPQYGILISKRDDLVDNGRNAFKSGDFSVLGGVQLNIGSAKVGGRYVVGLSNINDLNDSDKWRNQGFHLYVGFRII